MLYVKLRDAIDHAIQPWTPCPWNPAAEVRPRTGEDHVSSLPYGSITWWPRDREIPAGWEHVLKHRSTAVGSGEERLIRILRTYPDNYPLSSEQRIQINWLRDSIES